MFEAECQHCGKKLRASSLPAAVTKLLKYVDNVHQQYQTLNKQPS